MTAPVFSQTDTPKAILDLSGKWLVDNLPGFRWLKSRGALERKVGPQLHRLTLQSSKASRQGLATWVSPRLMILDDRLQEWRQTDPVRSIVADPNVVPPVVFNSLFVNFLKQWAKVELSGLSSSSEGPAAVDLNEFLRCLTENVLPVLDHFAEPSSLIDGLPTSWWWMVDSGTVEWALACDDPSEAAEIVRQQMEQPLKGQEKAEQRLSLFRDGWECQGRGERLKGMSSSLTALGWVSAANDLIEPDALRPAS